MACVAGSFLLVPRGQAVRGGGGGGGRTLRNNGLNKFPFYKRLSEHAVLVGGGGIWGAWRDGKGARNFSPEMSGGRARLGHGGTNCRDILQWTPDNSVALRGNHWWDFLNFQRIS
jgi:hypothetical protein